MYRQCHNLVNNFCHFLHIFTSIPLSNVGAEADTPVLGSPLAPSHVNSSLHETLQNIYLPHPAKVGEGWRGP